MFSPSRLALARKRRGLTLVELADRVGVTAQSLSNYENNRQIPSAHVVERIAEVLGFPAYFLIASELDPLSANDVSFRARSKLPARKRDMALSVG